MYATKSVTWNFHVDESQKKSRYDMIIGWELLLELKLDLCFSDQTIRGNGGAYEGCTISMNDTSDLRNGASFGDEKEWESEHVFDYTRHMRRLTYYTTASTRLGSISWERCSMPQPYCNWKTSKIAIIVTATEEKEIVCRYIPRNIFHLIDWLLTVDWYNSYKYQGLILDNFWKTKRIDCEIPFWYRRIFPKIDWGSRYI